MFIKKKTSDNTLYIDDITKLNKTQINKLFYVKTKNDITEIIKYANLKKLQISVQGQKHSMGGQSIVKNGIIIDIKYLNKILYYDNEKNLITVESGITWSKVIKFLNLYSKSPMVLQSYCSFSVGGTISVNAHGITSDFSMVESIENMIIITSENKFMYCNRNINSDLFKHVIGGYGLFGVIYSVTLRVTTNCSLKMYSQQCNIYNFNDAYQKLVNNNNIKIKLGRVNTTDFNKISLYAFENIGENIISNITEPKEMSLHGQFIYKWIAPTDFGKKIRSVTEKILRKPLDWNSGSEQNSLLYESALPLADLYSPFIDLNKTHILQEFFIPTEYFTNWMEFLIQQKKIFENVNLLNLTIRFVKQDNLTVLNYAKTDVYAFVFYYRINKTQKDDDYLKYIHNILTNKALTLNGSFYLPYRHHYSKKQLVTAYPNIDKFIEYKNNYDKNNTFNNLWFNFIKTF